MKIPYLKGAIVRKHRNYKHQRYSVYGFARSWRCPSIFPGFPRFFSLEEPWTIPRKITLDFHGNVQAFRGCLCKCPSFPRMSNEKTLVPILQGFQGLWHMFMETLYKLQGFQAFVQAFVLGKTLPFLFLIYSYCIEKVYPILQGFFHEKFPDIVQGNLGNCTAGLFQNWSTNDKAIWSGQNADRQMDWLTDNSKPQCLHMPLFGDIQSIHE